MAQGVITTAATSTWVDLTVASGSLASASAYVQLQDSARVFVLFSSSGTTPTSNNGAILLTDYGQIAKGTAAHIWVKAAGQSAAIAAGLTD